ncbi:MAG: hypothetical protein DI527_23985 [Chelatococcus sp.]|nr:MAG: hypothetical protein DI527_23985 [Chelatococcus sp.]
MPVYTVETTYHLPVYRQRNYVADTPEEACGLAVDDEGWEDGEEDVDTSGETYVTGLWEGADTAYSGADIPIPETFHETVQRKAEMFDALVAILKEPARPMGLSRHEFASWLPRATAVLARADAIGGEADADSTEAVCAPGREDRP